MLKRVSGVIYNFIFTGLFFGYIHLLWLTRNPMYFIASVVIFIFHPLVLRNLVKIHDEKLLYYEAVGLLLIFCGTLLMMYLALIIYDVLDFDQTDITVQQALENYAAILKVFIFLFYFWLLFEFKSRNKKIKYWIFGLLYAGCVILSFVSTETINMILISSLNSVTKANMDSESYALFREGCLEPIKEAVLTYIIFDTVIPEESKKFNKSIIL